MKSQGHPKLKTPAKPLFSCSIFGHCTQSVVLSPTTPHPPELNPSPLDAAPPPPPPPPPPPLPLPDDNVRRHQPSSSSSSSSSTSQSFTQWKFPLPDTPRSLAHVPPPVSIYYNNPELPTSTSESRGDPSPKVVAASLVEILHAAELQLTSGSHESRLAGLQLLERSLVPDPLPTGPRRPAAVLDAVTGFLKQQSTARAATKVLLALSLAESNRVGAVEAGAVDAIVEALDGMEVAAAERALAALELLCTIQEGAAALRSHALAVPSLVEAMGKMGGRGKECAISVLAAIYGGGGDGPPAAVAQAVVLALQGECSARGRRKGAQLLKALKENGRFNMI